MINKMSVTNDICNKAILWYAFSVCPGRMATVRDRPWEREPSVLDALAIWENNGVEGAFPLPSSFRIRTLLSTRA